MFFVYPGFGNPGFGNVLLFSDLKRQGRYKYGSQDMGIMPTCCVPLKTPCTENPVCRTRVHVPPEHREQRRASVRHLDLDRCGERGPLACGGGGFESCGDRLRGPPARGADCRVVSCHVISCHVKLCYANLLLVLLSPSLLRLLLLVVLLRMPTAAERRLAGASKLLVPPSESALNNFMLVFYIVDTDNSILYYTECSYTSNGSSSRSRLVTR